MRFNRLALAIVVPILILSSICPVFADDPVPTPGPVVTPVPDPTTPFGELATLSGIVVATLLVVEVIKRSTKSMPGIQSIPNWVLAVATAVGLTFVANAVLHTLDGAFLALAWQAALNAAGASGFYSWLRAPDAAPRDLLNA